MVESMEIDTDKGFFVLNSRGVKRSRQEQEPEKQSFERKRRGLRPEKMRFLRDQIYTREEEFLLSTHIVTDPDTISQYLEFTVDFQVNICQLASILDFMLYLLQ